MSSEAADFMGVGPGEQEFFVTCGRGLEGLVADELRSLGVAKPRPLASGVAFFGSIAQAYRACLWLRTASRVLLVLGRVEAGSSEQLYASCSDIAWEGHIAPEASFAIAARGVNDALRDSRFTALRAKDAIADRLSATYGSRPDVSRSRPDVLVNVNLHSERATISIDLSGEPLHRRGYRVPSPAIVAPLRETLAAALLLAGGWGAVRGLAGVGEGRVASRGGKGRRPSLAPADAPSFLVDPLCGSGTIAIEAAMMAADLAPGLLRDYWGFTGWLGHEEDAWQALLAEADGRAESRQAELSGQARPGLAPVLASDMDAEAIKVAQASASRAGVGRYIDFRQADVSSLSIPEGYGERHGLLATNPPFAQRLSTPAQLPALYAALSGLLHGSPSLDGAVVITPDDLAEAYLNPALGGPPNRRLQTMNGPSPTVIRAWRHADGGPEGPAMAVAALGEASADAPPAVAGRPDVTAFANRLDKMRRHRGRQARRAKVSCYRVYDADLPDFNMAIDVYQGAEGTADAGRSWLHIAEYRPPGDVDSALADARLAEALRIAPEVMGVATSDVFLKRRQRARGGSQYSDQTPTSAALHIIEEGGLLFQVDLASRLDTGIFLDHRITRGLLREKADGRDCLNLFAYTGTASAYMAAGGALSVTTVDLSRTYLDWAVENMRLNGIGDKPGQTLYYDQADVLRWVADRRAEAPAGASRPRGAARPAARHPAAADPARPNRFGLVFVDVPTFSNSSRMGARSFDVQRDHVELLIGVSRLLSAGGEAVFSTNLRSFEPDEAALGKAHVRIVDISASTIPPDFERTPRIHRCYLVSKED